MPDRRDSFKNDSIYVRGIDPALKNGFKSLCVLQGISMSKKIEELMKQEVEQFRKLKGKG
jgi:hypothetical protein